MESRIIENEIHIDAPASEVWDILTNPSKTKIYMYGCEPVTDWKVGSSILWNGVHEGVVTTFVKGHILAIEPQVMLSYSVIDPLNPDIPDIPENYLTVTYLLTAEDGGTTFKVTQGDYSTVANGPQRYEDTMAQGGWSSILSSIRDLAENGTVE